MVNQSIEEKLQVMRDHFGEALPGRLTDIENSWRDACAGGSQAQETLRRRAHSLAGSGETFGFHVISDAARALERAVQAVEAVDSIAASGAITARMAELKSAVAVTGDRRSHELDALGPKTGRPQGDDRKLIYLADADAEFGENLVVQIEHFGYQVKFFSELGDLADAVRTERPRAILTDAMFPEGKLAGIEAIEEIQAQLDEPIPVYFISLRDDIEARLKSVRAGGLAYFSKPVDIIGIIDRLDQLVDHEPPEPFRVLVIDDQVEMTDYYRLILENAGMQVATINDPKKVLIEMVGFCRKSS